MSKAFTREDDSADPVLQRPISILPPGVKNYMTPQGAEQLRQELKDLVEEQRPRLVNAPDPDAARHDLQMLDQRIAALNQSLQSAVIVEPPAQTDSQVRFGAKVRVREKSGVEARYRIVGVDEADFDKGWISWRSPLARALMNAHVGQRVRFKTPEGEEALEILGVDYE